MKRSKGLVRLTSRFKRSTVGLVTAEEFKRRRDIIENGAQVDTTL